MPGALEALMPDVLGVHIYGEHLFVIVIGAWMVTDAMDRLTQDPSLAVFSSVIWGLLCAACGIVILH